MKVYQLDLDKVDPEQFMINEELFEKLPESLKVLFKDITP